jgi:hypothetical protein
MQPASVVGAVELSFAPAWPVWPGLLAQVASPERKAMPTTEQPEQEICLRIATLLFAVQKRAYQKVRAERQSSMPTRPPRRLVAPGRTGLAFNYLMVML